MLRARQVKAMEKKLLEYFRAHEAEIFEDLKALVRLEASTADVDELAKVREGLVSLVRERVGAECTVHDAPGGHCPISFEFGQGERKLLLIGHYDTVCRIGSMPLYEKDGELHGPGVLDMKSGDVSAIWAMKAYKELGIDPGKRLVMAINGDEETGSAESKDVIDALAEGAAAALVCEPATSKGNLKTGRKGKLSFMVRIKGRAAHAGNAHSEGVNAIEEAASEILRIQRLTDYSLGTTVNVGVIRGGTKVNVVPDYAEFEIDCRVSRASEMDRIRAIVESMETEIPGASREVECTESTPVMEQTPANLALAAKAEAVARRLGFALGHEFVGGSSDGNHVAQLGVPILDGLGAWGDGGHAVHEHIIIDRYVERIALLAELILEL